MKRPRRPLIAQRRRVFLGCEGESERGYGALINRLLESRRRDVHLDIVLLKPGGGDPLPLIELAARRISEGERKREAPYVHRAVLLDADRRGQAPARDAHTGHRRGDKVKTPLEGALPRGPATSTPRRM